MLRYVVLLLPVYVLFRLAYLMLRRQKPAWSCELLFALCAAYGIALVSQTLLPSSVYGIEDLEIYVQTITGGYRSYNLIPMNTIGAYLFTQNDRVSDWGSVALLNLSANVALFVPLGLLAPITGERFRRLRSVLTLGLAVTLAIEIGQFLIGRSADVDDVMLNVLGAGIGYGLWVLVQRMRRVPQPAEVTESA
ncbi:MAG: VanZ family protein [Coriobacteriia bacterium]|nr:VanZ family protein [Coriobacteriia bacterium]